MTRNLLILIAAGGSLALLIGAYGFEYIGDIAPCKMCWWQRYPHMVAVVLGLLALISGLRFWSAFGVIAAATSGAIGVYHTGVERNWWEGPTTCTSGPIGNLTPEELLQQITNAPLIRCDEVAWEMFTLSMASWNALASFGLAAIWVVAWRIKA